MKTSLLLILALAAFVSGCAHRTAYNDVIAANTAVLNERTSAAVSDGDAGRLSLAESRKFLRQSQEQVRRLRSRADECRLSFDEVSILDWLDGEYTALLRRPQPVRSSSTVRLQNSLATLQVLRPLRTYSVVTSDTTTTTSSDSMDNDTTNTCDTKKKDCDKDHDHHHGDKDCGCDRNHR